MLSAGLSSTYQQYKHDTNVVASWLATTALGAGFSATLGQPGNAPKAGGSQRLKGKARKEAKKLQPTEPKSTQDHAKPKHIIAIKDFVPLASYISEKLFASLTLPEYFSSALNRAIEARKSFSVLLRDFRPFREVSDKKHTHFVTVLEKVRDVFSSSVSAFNMATMSAAVDTAKTPKDSLPGSVVETRNMFDALRVHEPSESFLAAPDVPPPSSASVEYGVEEEDAEIESLFVFSTLLADLFQLRDEVRAMWTDYKAGTRDLAAVSVATNAALQLARSMETEISPLIDKLGGPIELIPMAFGGACEARGLDPGQKKSFSDDFNYDCYEEANLFMYTSISLLDAYRKVPTSRTNPFYNGSYGWYDERTTASSNRQRWQDDKAALLEVFADQTLLTTTLKGVPIRDEFSRGLHIMMKTKKIPGIWLCFAASTYLDILKVLGPDVRKGEQDFQRITRSIADDIARCSEAYGSRTPELKKAIKDIQELSTMWAPGRDIFKMFRVAGGIQDRDSAFLAHNPLFCGLYVHFVRALFHRTGIEFASKAGNVMHSVQLYQALRQEKLLGEDYKRQDLEAILESQGTSAFFVGNPPTSLDGYFKNFGLTKGISATHWVPTNRNQRGRLPKSQAGIRIMKFKAIISLVFATMAEVSSDSRGLNAETIDKILEKTGWFKKGRTSEFSEEQGSPSATSPAEHDGKRNKTRRALTPVELVHELCLAIEYEVPEVMFDYFGLEVGCKELLKRVRASVDAGSGNGSLPPEIIGQIDDDKVSDIVGVIFGVAVGKGLVNLMDSTALLIEAASAFKEGH
ncbi:hypothetical protein CPLU01_12447 [Colletotrichum plurivorum]|uniref:DUF6604 domain-containing protein n=1 Tax=Colletotrichum plurivorum TaxID=2175906 RepID=A0A8H6N6W8_9PEZI|nr:hypothetical protein CPLU01_12447 [Colletotrichum plurivorum]